MHNAGSAAGVRVTVTPCTALWLPCSVSLAAASPCCTSSALHWHSLPDILHMHVGNASCRPAWSSLCIAHTAPAWTMWLPGEPRGCLCSAQLLLPAVQHSLTPHHVAALLPCCGRYCSWAMTLPREVTSSCARGAHVLSVHAFHFPVAHINGIMLSTGVPVTVGHHRLLHCAMACCMSRIGKQVMVGPYE